MLKESRVKTNRVAFLHGDSLVISHWDFLSHYGISP